MKVFSLRDFESVKIRPDIIQYHVQGRSIENNRTSITDGIQNQSNDWISIAEFNRIPIEIEENVKIRLTFDWFWLYSIDIVIGIPSQSNANRSQSNANRSQSNVNRSQSNYGINRINRINQEKMWIFDWRSIEFANRISIVRLASTYFDWPPLVFKRKILDFPIVNRENWANFLEFPITKFHFPRMSTPNFQGIICYSKFPAGGEG